MGKRTLTEHMPSGHTVGDRLSRENEYNNAMALSRRNRATWNACEGIPTEALEAGVVAELLAVAKAVEQWQRGGAQSWFPSALLNQVIGAIRKCEGGK